MPGRDRSKGLPKRQKKIKERIEEKNLNYPAIVFLIIALLANLYIVFQFI